MQRESQLASGVFVVVFLIVGACGGGSTVAKLDAPSGTWRDSATNGVGDDSDTANTAADLGAGVNREAPAADRPDNDGGQQARVDATPADEGWPDAGHEDTSAQADIPIAEADVRVVGAEAGLDAAGDGVEPCSGLPTDADTSEGGSRPGAPLDAAALDGGGGDGSADGRLGPALAIDTALGGIDGPLPRVWVYVMAGQSNMLGQASNPELSAVDSQPVPNAEIYFISPLETNSRMKAWLPVAPGFGWHDDQFGPEVGFARRYHALYPDRHLAIIKVSQGATELYDLWKAPTGALYQLLTSTVREEMVVLSARGRPEIAGFLWMQGESDGTVLDHANSYRDNLLAMVRELRVDIGLATMPIVAGLIATDCCWTYADTIRKSTTAVSTTAGNMTAVETDDLPMVKNDPRHYSAAGQLELGTRFANAATALLGTRWKFPDGFTGIQGESDFTYRERAGAASTMMTFSTAYLTWSGPAGASIQKSGMTPWTSQQAELAWSAPFAGKFQINVSAVVPDLLSSGGVVEVSDGTRAVWGPWPIDSGTTITSIFSRDMEQKDQLYFRTSAGRKWNPSYDAVSWQIDIDATAISSFWSPSPPQ